ncbi:MAG TPA: hypothetical protein VGP13_01725 [Candidatus Paceibacterota bacterium]|jgi:hypothetical protein|nr:hypothetical protein [Candidatus Paceibacterota bacterium]
MAKLAPFLLAFLLFLTGASSPARGSSFNFPAMQEACRQLDILKGDSPTLCRVEIDKLELQWKTFKGAAADKKFFGDAESAARMLEKSKQLDPIYAKIQQLYPTVWRVRQAPLQ